MSVWRSVASNSTRSTTQHRGPHEHVLAAQVAVPVTHHPRRPAPSHLLAVRAHERLAECDRPIDPPSHPEACGWLGQLLEVLLPRREHQRRGCARHQGCVAVEARQRGGHRRQLLRREGLGGDEARERVLLPEAAHLHRVLERRRG